MFDFGWPELLVIAIVLIVVVGPKDLPRVLRGFGRTTSKLKVMAGDFRKQFDEALREAELDDVKGLADEARKLDPRREIRKHMEPLNQVGRDIRSGLDDATKPKAKEATGDTAQESAPAKTGATAIAGEDSKAAKSVSAKNTAAAKPAAGKKASSTKPAAAKKASGEPVSQGKAPGKSAATTKTAAKRPAPKSTAGKKKTTGTAP
ncbi:Sec-independent protein translocase protein TatB [Nitratireductor sp. GCM10026969]|uniref:Sec-independent protein translocase protein TatB n=1 Tax=Nitratireductor sp. GCM10026969 TaxID=3252645 RepID=UPI00361800B7